jgi:hypothetical protein
MRCCRSTQRGTPTSTAIHDYLRAVKASPLARTRPVTENTVTMVQLFVITSSLYGPRHLPQIHHSHANPIYAQDKILVDREIRIC